MLNINGHKISKIAKMSDEEVTLQVRSLCETSNRFPDQVNELTISMMELDEPRFERVVARNILRFGFEKTMMEIIYPFFRYMNYSYGMKVMGRFILFTPKKMNP